MTSSAVSRLDPPSPSPTLSIPAPTRAATVSALDALSALVDGVVAMDRLIGWASAARAQLIEAAVQWSETTHLPPQPAPAGPRWDPSVVAFRTVVSELAVALRLPNRTAESLVGESTALVRDLPGTHTALTEGRISYRHARVVIDHAMSVPAGARAGLEDAVLTGAELLTVAKLERKARRVRERTHPESIRERHRASVADRQVQVTPERDGMAWLGARLPAPDALGIHARITDLAVGLQGPHEKRTMAQLRADVFADLLLDGVTTDCAEERACDGACDGARDAAAAADNPMARPPHRRRIRKGVGRGVVARVFVTVPVMTLLGHADEPGELEGYGPIDAETARGLAAGASGFTRLLTHPESGVVLSVGRDRYKVPKQLRTWLRLRDETCRFPGCGRSAGRSDIDHSLDWQLSGPTAHDNLAHLCRAHHSLKHQSAWTVRHARDGTLEWTSPTGRSYATAPATIMRPPDRDRTPVPRVALTTVIEAPAAPSPAPGSARVPTLDSTSPPF
jgi:hypothetical protein